MSKLNEALRVLRLEWWCAKHFRWVVIDPWTGQEHDAYRKWALANHHARSAREGLVVIYERPITRFWRARREIIADMLG